MQMSEELVWELFVQAGPVGTFLSSDQCWSVKARQYKQLTKMYVCAVNVYLPKDRVTNMHQQYGFVEYRGEEDADYVSCS